MSIYALLFFGGLFLYFLGLLLNALLSQKGKGAIVATLVAMGLGFALFAFGGYQWFGIIFLENEAPWALWLLLALCLAFLGAALCRLSKLFAFPNWCYILGMVLFFACLFAAVALGVRLSIAILDLKQTKVTPAELGLFL